MWASRVFGVSTTNILFVENDQFLVFKSEKEEDLKKYDCHMGLSGEAKNRRSIIISDVQASKEYNSLVDSSSLMPVYFAPVLLQEDRKEECLG
eukprot:CAMPEP_0114599334 /NCGR_PEP_ID=MMETSP0125-20121206/21856_1 /TAXON_ID=485358 ORGANISM="Aristerostoma sp., Strain ATCC 50986" /NCGR_SAMPLE_ID=MMETSP0125 /ASSEMBLY_ACC=CAM_ASM_000245 /LENGTH=92 /DNA_ID=CAMNT_0001806265 /DNA_START=638 /DNA_END=912 /DNA_ORIENTATION=+